MIKEKKLSVVIAALNEEPRIPNVLRIVSGHPLVSEVIVINDGSEDNTSQVAKMFDATVIDHTERQGKTNSVYEGIKKAKQEYVLLLDADLSGLTAEHIKHLAEPVLSGKCDFSLSLRGNSLKIYRLFGIDFVSGERVLKKELLSDNYIWAKKNIPFSLEVRMNRSFLRKKLKFQAVPLDGLKNSMKSKKYGFWRGLWGDIKMLLQINRALPLPIVIFQFFKMAYLNKKYRKELYGS